MGTEAELLPRDFAEAQALTELIGYTGGGLALGYYSDPYDQEERAAKQAENAVGFEPQKEGIIL